MGVEEFRARAEELISENARLEEGARKIGGKRAASAMTTFSKIRSLIIEMRELEAKEKEIDNADIATKLKFSRKAKKAGKEFWRIVKEINALHAKGGMEESDAKQFGKVLELIKTKKVPEAERELLPFKRLEALAKETERVRSRMEELGGEVDSRIGYLRNELAVLLPKETVEGLEKKEKEYRESERILGNYGAWREKQIERLRGMPVARLIKACASNSDLYALGFPKPRDEFSLDELGSFLVSSKIDGNADEVLRLNDLKVDGLKSIVADHHQFRRLVSENSRWLEAISELGRSDFLKFDFGNEERKLGVLSAIALANEKSLGEEVKRISTISLSQYEEMKSSVSRLEKAKKPSALDKNAITSELSELQAIRGILPPGDEE